MSHAIQLAKFKADQLVATAEFEANQLVATAEFEEKLRNELARFLADQAKTKEFDQTASGRQICWLSADERPASEPPALGNLFTRRSVAGRSAFERPTDQPAFEWSTEQPVGRSATGRPTVQPGSQFAFGRYASEQSASEQLTTEQHKGTDIGTKLFIQQMQSDDADATARVFAGFGR